jgi:L-2,4-diaminobutyrate decarboxylase
MCIHSQYIHTYSILSLASRLTIRASCPQNMPDNTDLDKQILNVLNHVAVKALERHKNLLADKIVDVASLDEVARLRKAAIPRSQPRELKDVLKEAESVYEHRLRNDHPAFFGFIPSPVSKIAWLGDMINSTFNTHAGSWFQSSGPSAIEDSLLEWLARQAGFPHTAGGCFTSGGSMANLSALVLARDKRLPIEQRATGRAYVSDQTHASVAKAMRILGFSSEQIRMVPTDNNFRMSAEKLRIMVMEDVHSGSHPFLVIASCGTTNVGAVDPLVEISKIALMHKMWMHIDGAYGASAMLSKSYKHLTKGLGCADSMSMDGHKWLFQTFACGMLIVKNKRDLLASFATSADYIQDAEGAEATPNFWNLGIELTRPARAMKLWFTLQVLGLDEMGRMIDHGFRLAECAEAELRKLEGWAIAAPASMAIVNFRYAPAGKGKAELDELNKAISKEAIRRNLAGALTTEVQGKTVMRMCTISPELSSKEMLNILKELNKIAKQLESRMSDQ